MRIVVAPGSFGAALSAVEAAAAIAEGWARHAPGDALTLAPLSDGGAGFVDVLHASLGGDLVAAGVSDVYGDAVPASILLAGGTAYVESAQAFVASSQLDRTQAERATSVGVGQLLAAALGSGARRVVIGVGAEGGSGAPGLPVAANDGGAGVLAALGATAEPAGALTGGAAGLAALTAVDLAPVVAACGGAQLVLATDDDSPLLGLMGTTKAAGASRGIDADRVPAVDALLERLAAAAGHRLALSRGAGAAGGVGYALLVAGASRAPGLGTVAAEIGLPTLMARADLVVTGEAALDFRGGSGALSAAVAAQAAAAVRPCIALASSVAIGARESRALGIESAYGVAETLHGRRTTGDAAADLAALAERVARTWSWSR